MKANGGRNGSTHQSLSEEGGILEEGAIAQDVFDHVEVGREDELLGEDAAMKDSTVLFMLCFGCVESKRWPRGEEGKRGRRESPRTSLWMLR